MKKTFIATLLLAVILLSNIMTAVIAYNRGSYYGEKKAVSEVFDHISDLDVGDTELVALNGEEIGINERISFILSRTN